MGRNPWRRRLVPGREEAGLLERPALEEAPTGGLEAG